MDRIDYPLQYRRQTTRVTRIGHLTIGGDHPILIQSMLTSPTRDTTKCLNEVQELVQAGCQLIRLAVPARKDLEAIPALRRRIQEEGFEVALVADIHFAPQLAVDACECFEKVRINPGNFSDISKNANRSTEGIAFEEGRERLREALVPLVRNLKKYGRALRVGVNHGSLSSRMIERYGDTPIGMVESALETVELLDEAGFDQTVISLKSSNPLVVQKAYRLLVEKQRGKPLVPTHLGVTEAGNGEMARVKSLVGIGVLLEDGIGDTIRVSLAEPSANEIVFAKKLVSAIASYDHGVKGNDSENWRRPLDHQRPHNSNLVLADGLEIGDASSVKIGVSADDPLPSSELTLEADVLFQVKSGQYSFQNSDIQLTSYDNLPTGVVESAADHPILFKSISRFELRRFYLNQDQAMPPIGMLYPSEDTVSLRDEIEFAGILSEGLVDFILISPSISSDQLDRLLLLLQATRAKIITTDYIICPSCGRTQFDLQETSEKIKRATNHLKGLKIGIMGCVVNGPGEMADADFGYVGSGPGKVDLYFGQTKVKKGINEDEAVGELLALIKEKGLWR